MGAAYLEGLGHLIMFGLGGIYVELFKDVVYRMNPIRESEALSMIRSINSYPLLSGIRGQEGVDVSRLAEILLRLSQLIGDHPQIKELDLNPIIAYKEAARTRVVDARVKV